MEKQWKLLGSSVKDCSYYLGAQLITREPGDNDVLYSYCSLYSYLQLPKCCSLARDPWLQPSVTAFGTFPPWLLCLYSIGLGCLFGFLLGSQAEWTHHSLLSATDFAFPDTPAIRETPKQKERWNKDWKWTRKSSFREAKETKYFK